MPTRPQLQRSERFKPEELPTRQVLITSPGERRALWQGVEPQANTRLLRCWQHRNKLCNDRRARERFMQVEAEAVSHQSETVVW
jgi:hypothetical protein